MAAYGRGVERLLVLAGAAVALWAVCCLLMIVSASRLPPGLLRQVAEFLPSCVAAARTLRRHPDVPRRAKVALLVAVVWVVSPIDLLPEFLPVIGPLDDVVAVILLLRYAARSIPRQTLLAAWPTDPRLLERVLGRDPGSPTPLMRERTKNDTASGQDDSP
jgi:uncharacterized membrane protein YkvA (DUF1232 family)